MAGMIAGDIKNMLSIHIKPRHDSIPDQYSRIFMVKLLLVCTIIIGVNQYNDKVTCIIPGKEITFSEFLIIIFADVCSNDRPEIICTAVGIN